ncbi:MAG: class I SAM-dependent methyltransferase [Methanoregula sp.]|nr:class I SAM-dependent methyltransferase [Methanoregula sp.]
METSLSEKNPAGDLCRYSYLHVLMLDNVFRRFFQNPAKILNRYIRPGMTVIDIGCGPGTFALAMAEMIGENGTVIATDVQSEMLQYAKKKSDRSGLSSRITWHQNSPDCLGIEQKADFVLSFHMVHEVPDQDRFLREVFSIIKSGGKYLVAEPVFHVSELAFSKTLENAARAGFMIEDRPEISMSRAVLLAKP